MLSSSRAALTLHFEVRSGLRYPDTYIFALISANIGEEMVVRMI